MTVIECLLVPFYIVFNIILFEKWGFFNWLNNVFFVLVYKKTKIFYTEVCYFCFCFWASLVVCTFLYFGKHLTNYASFVLYLAYFTVTSRYLTIQILRK